MITELAQSLNIIDGLVIPERISCVLITETERGDA
jgi:hypothetical protein